MTNDCNGYPWLLAETDSDLKRVPFFLKGFFKQKMGAGKCILYPTGQDCYTHELLLLD